MIRKNLLVIAAVGVFAGGAHDGNVRAQTGETALRGALCAIENGNFAGAQAALEKILRDRPQETTALRLWPGVLARQIKKDDPSAENAARVRRAIEAYERFAATAPVSDAEKAEAARYVFVLLDKLAPAEKTAELRRMAADETRPPKVRARAYAELAHESQTCAARVFEKSRKPPASGLARAKACTSEGLEAARRALALDDGGETTRLVQYSLLDYAARIAGLENDAAQSQARRREAAAAMRKYKEASERRRRAMSEPEESPSRPPSESTAADFAKELVTYKFEKPLERLVGRENIGGYPARLYTFTAGYCRGPQSGTIAVVAGPNRNYAFTIRGEPADGASVRRFLKSLKIGK